MKIYTKTGDAGDTGLFGGGRVQKDDPRVEAYGDVDELNAVLGMARAVEPMPRIDEVLVPMQRDLFSIGALLATPDLEKMHGHLTKANIDDRRIRDLEHAIDDCEKELEPLKAFIIPGAAGRAQCSTSPGRCAGAPSAESCTCNAKWRFLKSSSFT